MSIAKVRFANEPQEYQYDLSILSYGVNQMDLWYDIVRRTDDDFAFAKKIEQWLTTAKIGDTYSDDILTVTIFKV